MRKICALLLVLLLLSGAGALAEPTLPTPAEVCHVIDSLHTKHQAQHTLLSAALDQDGFRTDCVFPDTQPDILMGCAEFYLPVKTALPSLAPDVSLLFSRALESAMALTNTMEGARLINLSIYERQPGQNVGVVVPPETWWREGQNDVFDMFVSPILLIDEAGAVIDEAVYMLVVYYTESLTGIWVCADQDICAEMMYALTPPEADGDESTRFLRAWLEGRGLLEAPPAAETAAHASSPPPDTPTYRVLGTVTVTYHSRANIRASSTTESRVVGHAFTGETFSVLDIADNGWYRILYESETAYIAPGIVAYTPN